MKSLPFRLHLITTCLWSPFLIGFSIANYMLMLNSAEQEWYFLKVNMVFFPLFFLLSHVLLYWKMQKVYRIQKVEECSDASLLTTGKVLLNLPLYAGLLQAGFYMFVCFLWYFIFSYLGLIPLAALVLSSLGFAGFLAVPSATYFLFGAVTSRSSSLVNHELSSRNLSAQGVSINIFNKSLLSNSISIIGMSLLVLAFAFYYAINQSIHQELRAMQQVQEVLVNSVRNHSGDEKMTLVKKLYLDNNTATHYDLLLLNSSGDLLFQSVQGEVFSEKWQAFNASLKSDLAAGKPVRVYSNENGNLMTFYPLTSNIYLTLRSNVSSLLGDQYTFVLSAIVILILGFVVTLTIAVSNSHWLNNTINHLNVLLRAVSKGDLTKLAGKNSEDEMATMVESYNAIVRQLSEVVQEIKNGAKEVSTTSQTLGEMSGNIASEAGKQASTTEELSASMEQMLATIHSNTDLATDTGNIATKTATQVQDSNVVFNQVINAVTDISDRVAMISEIASQTNILSLNASVEAARAGEFGKGFTVLSKEIRKLSEKTNEVAKEIKTYSISGQQVSQDAANQLNQLIPEIIKSTEAVASMVASSQEQRSGVEAVNSGIQQLAEGASRYSHSAEQMSLSANALAKQSSGLSKTVALFKLR